MGPSCPGSGTEERTCTHNHHPGLNDGGQVSARERRDQEHRGQRSSLALRSQRSEVHVANQGLEAMTSDSWLNSDKAMLKWWVKM